MIKIGYKFSPVTNSVLDFNGNKINYFEVLGEDEDIKGNLKVLVYPETGFCSVDSILENEILDSTKFKEIL